MTDQPQSGPPRRAGAGSEPAGDMPAAVGPDALTEVHPAGAAAFAPGTSGERAKSETPAGPPSPPPAIGAAMDRQNAGVPPGVAPPGESPAVSPPPVPPVSDWRPADDLSSGGPAALAAERPEVAVGAAFAGGLVLALILKRLAR